MRACRTSAATREGARTWPEACPWSRASKLRGFIVHTRLKFAGLVILATIIGTGCGDSFTTDHSATTPNGMRPSFATMGGVASSITLDQAEAAVDIGTGWTQGGTHVGKEFDENPHLGDAIVATFVWQGTTNTITSVTDHLEDGTPVGNTYTL